MNRAMDSQLKYRVMALAAVCQAVELVRLVAREDNSPEQLHRIMFKSITMVDADNPEQIYGDMHDLSLGYRTLCQQLGNQPEKDVDITRYIVSILTLERKLTPNGRAMSKLGERIGDLQRSLSHFDILDSNIVANMADIYSEVISPLGKRIEVFGSPQFLQVQANQHKVRALLLAAVRAAVLWRQLGGKRRQLIFSRQAILDVAQHSLNHL